MALSLACWGLMALFALIASAQASFLPTDPSGLRLIQVGPNPETDRRLVSPREILRMVHERHENPSVMMGPGFVDLTGLEYDPAELSLDATNTYTYPNNATQQHIVWPLIQELDKDKMTSFLGTFSTFHNRYYMSPTGVESHEWLLDHVTSIARQAGRNDISCRFHHHVDFPQPSVICTMRGNSPNSTIRNQIVVCSAHSDSINTKQPLNGRAPGVDDDGSGVAGCVEIMRVLANSNYRPSRTIEFHAYAAEEVGLRGSASVAQTYFAKGTPVYAVAQNEMSGYVKPGITPHINLVNDNVHQGLVSLMEELALEYVDLPTRRTTCGYACSDHASWTQYGIGAVATAEAGPKDDWVNPKMHTDGDDMDLFNPDYALEFAKLNMAFIVECAEFRG